MTTSVAKWQDWASFALGLWLAVSPWAAGYSEHESATANAAFVGLALALGSHFEATCEQVQAEWINLAVGIWLAAAPFVLGFSGVYVPTANSITVGTFVVFLAASALSLDREVGKVWQKCGWHKRAAGR
jgi:hypothetical protein